MVRTFTCIMCPNGCDIEAVIEDGNVISMEGNLCKRGAEYVEQEIVDPKRTIASSVLVKHGELPLVSVRLDRPIPKDRIFDVMKEIAAVSLEAPVAMGDVVIENVLGLGSNVIATKNVGRK